MLRSVTVFIVGCSSLTWSRVRIFVGTIEKIATKPDCNKRFVSVGLWLRLLETVWQIPLPSPFSLAPLLGKWAATVPHPRNQGDCQSPNVAGRRVGDETVLYTSLCSSYCPLSAALDNSRALIHRRSTTGNCGQGRCAIGLGYLVTKT